MRPPQRRAPYCFNRRKMLFTSYEFVAFAAIVFILFYIVPKPWQTAVLTVASLAFVTSYSVTYLPFILFTAVTTYISARLMTKQHESRDLYLSCHKAEMSREERKAYKDKTKARTRVFLWGTLLLNLGILAFLKYANFVIYNVNSIFKIAEKSEDLFLTLILPIGISFYTFMCVGYLVDVYREKYKAEKSLLKVTLFASYFPSLVQGPFSKFDELGKTLFAPKSLEYDAVWMGLLRVVWGYFKKVVLADRVVIALNEIIGDPTEYTGAYVFAGIILYSLRIYADFTGGIDITLGYSEMLGIKLKENFIRPYFSKNIAEYWRRWHISLGEWFREYLFYPLSICGPINKLAKKLKPRLGQGFAKRLPVYFSTILVWFVTGVWHGAAWNFIAWGMANCVVILISQELQPLYAKFHKKTGIGEGGAYGVFMMLRTYLLMCCIRMFDCYATVGETFSAFGSMFTTGNYHVLFDGSMLSLGLDGADYMILLFGVILILISSIIAEYKTPLRNTLIKLPGAVPAAVVILSVLVLIFGAYGIGFDASQFIYNQF